MERGPGQVMSGDGFDGDFPEEFGEGWAGERMSRIVGRRLSKEEARFAAECLQAAPVPERARKTAERSPLAPMPRRSSSRFDSWFRSASTA